MIQLSKTFEKAKKDMSMRMQIYLPRFIKIQHYHKGQMLDGTKLPKYSTGYIQNKKRIYRGFSDLYQYGRMHNSIKVLLTPKGLKVYIDAVSYMLLTQPFQKKVWEHWYITKQIGKPFENLMKKENNLHLILK